MIVLELSKWCEIQSKLIQTHQQQTHQQKLIRSPDKFKFRIETFEKKMLEYTCNEYITTMVCLFFDQPEDEVLFSLKLID